MSRRAMLSLKPWKPDRVVWLLGALLATFALGMLVVQSYQWAFVGADEKGTVKLPAMLLGTLMTQGLALFLVGLFLKQHQITWGEAFGFRSPRRARALLLGILAGAIVIPITQGLVLVSTWILEQFSQPVVQQQSVQALQRAGSLSEIIYFGLMATVAAPVVEEIIYRGIIYPAIKQEGFPKIALWVTSILFAFSHVNLMTFLPLVFLGVILICLYETTDNLIAPITAHSLFNAINYIWMLHHFS